MGGMGGLKKNKTKITNLEYVVERVVYSLLFVRSRLYYFYYVAYKRFALGNIKHTPFISKMLSCHI